MPVFLYADDLEAYQSDRNRLYFDMHHLPFPFAETEDELVGCIQAFDWKRYEEQLNTFFEPMELSEDGRAAERVERMIERLIES